VDPSNLQRQVLHGTRDVGRAKTDSARDRILDVNPHVEVVTHAARLEASNAREILEGYEIVVDGTDNFPARYLVNDACVLLDRPYVYGSVFRFEGQASVFGGVRGPCYRCLHPEPPPPGAVPSCAEGGVLGVLPGIIGTIQATETIKIALGRGGTLLGRLLLFDALEMRFEEVRLARNPRCPVCGDEPSIVALRDEQGACAPSEGAAPDTAAPGAAGGLEWEITAPELRTRLAAADPPLLLDVRPAREREVCRIEGDRHVPLHLLPARLSELDDGREIVVYCRLGGSSAQAVRFLLQAGFRKVRNLTGGIDAWRETVDPSMPRY
jgi:adenylyltransferase/sulfurtransferase